MDYYPILIVGALTAVLSVQRCRGYEFYSNFTCDFSKDWCNWRNPNTTKEFVRNRGQTNIDDTGPDAGHTDGTSSDFYIYYPGHDNGKDGNYAELISPAFGNACAVACFRFWYHMCGQYVNKMEVGLVDNNNSTVLFVKNGNLGNEWRCGYIPIQNCRNKQIFIRAYKSQRGILSEIAFDDLAVTFVDAENPCSQQVCDISAGGFSSTTRVASTSDLTSTTPQITTSETTTHSPDSHSTSAPLYLLSLLAVPFVVLFIGVIYIMKKKRKIPQDTSRHLSVSNSTSYASDPTRYGDRSLPEAPEEEVYHEINDLKSSADSEYITSVADDKDEYSDTSIDNLYREIDLPEDLPDHSNSATYMNAAGVNTTNKSSELEMEYSEAFSPPSIQNEAILQESSFINGIDAPNTASSACTRQNLGHTDSESAYPDDSPLSPPSLPEVDDGNTNYLTPITSKQDAVHSDRGSKHSNSINDTDKDLDDDYLRPSFVAQLRL